MDSNEQGLIMLMRNGIRSLMMALVGLALVAFATPSPAQVLTDAQLLNGAMDAYGRRDWIEAAPYLYAYIQRSPVAMASDEQHAQSIRTAYQYVLSELTKGRDRCANEEQQLAALQAQSSGGVGTRTSGLTAAPPAISPPNAVPSPDWASLSGRYSMVHDGWKGMLALGPSGSKYTDANGKVFNVLTEVIGYHITFYVVGLGGQNADEKGGQKFDGYLMTQTKDAIAGVTWWEGRPFGFFATKQPRDLRIMVPRVREVR